MDPDVVNRVGRYELLEELGSGGMATVYLARQADLDRRVALKELSALRTTKADLTRRFLREARVAGALTHPNIVTVYEYFEEGGTPYIAMEYVPHGSLRPYVGRLTLAQFGGVLEGILGGLARAEEQEVVHRDLKPENMLVSADGAVKIADFGIAKATNVLRKTASLTAIGTTLGTPQYMAPEQAKGEQVGPWTDLYSVGTIAFELLAGSTPFHDTEEPMAVLMRQVHEPPPPLTSVRPQLDPRISHWVEGLLAKSPGSRPQSAREAWDELEGILLAQLGPRWRREGALPIGLPPAPPGPLTPPPIDGPQGAMTQAWVEGATQRMRSDDLGADAARTIAPRTRPLKEPAPTVPVDDRPGAPGRRRILWRRLAALVIVLAAIAIAILQLRACAGSQDSAPAASANSELSLVTPGGWSQVEPAPDVGLPLVDPIAVAPGGNPNGPMVIYGVMRGDAVDNSSLLPSSFLNTLGLAPGKLPPRSDVVLTGQQLQAWRYRDIRPLGSTRGLTIYTVPTSQGIATVICAVPPTDPHALDADCEPIASTLQLHDARPYPIGPDEAYANVLNDTLTKLQAAVRHDGQELGLASTPAGQAAAADRLARAYSTGAQALGALRLRPADRAANAALVAALERAQRGYEDVASAATAGDSKAYRQALAAAAQDEAAIDGPLAGLEAAGYSAGAGAGATGSPSTASGADSGASDASGAPDSASGGSDAAPPAGAGDSQSDDPSDDEPDHGEA